MSFLCTFVLICCLIMSPFVIHCLYTSITASQYTIALVSSFQINISFFFYFASVPNCEPLNLSLKPSHTKKTLVWHRYNNANNGGVFFKTCRLYYNKLAHGELVWSLSMLKCFNIYRLKYKQSFVCSSVPASLKLSIHLKKKSKHILKHVYFKFIRPMYGIRWIFVTVICLINKLWHALLFIFKDKFLTLFRNAKIF